MDNIASQNTAILFELTQQIGFILQFNISTFLPAWTQQTPTYFNIDLKIRMPTWSLRNTKPPVVDDVDENGKPPMHTLCVFR